MENNFIHGLKTNQLDNTNKNFQRAYTLRGIVTRVYPHAGLAEIAVEGGDFSANPQDIVVVSLKPGFEGVLEEVNNIGSGFTSYMVKVTNVVEGDLVNLQFVQGSLKPTMVSKELNLQTDDESNLNPVVIIDKKNKVFRFLTGSNETSWIKNKGIPGYKFSPFSQNPKGAYIQVARARKMQKLLTAKTITRRVITEASKVSTPAGHVVWTDANDTGHVATFADSVHVFSKEQNHISMGSNEPVGQYLKDPLADLATALGIEEKPESVNLKFDSKTAYGISPILTALAEAELKNWQVQSQGYVSLPEISDSFFDDRVKQSGSIAKTLKSASMGSTNGNMNYYVSTAIAAGAYTVGSLISRGQAQFQSVNNLSSVATFNPDTSDNQTLRAYLDGTGFAWANLVAAIRLAILLCPQSVVLLQALRGTQLSIYKADGDTTNTGQGIMIPNLFGFRDTGIDVNSLAGSEQFIVNQVMPTGFALSKKSSTSPYTYGDLIHMNYWKINSEAQSWITSTDILVPNMIAFASGSSRFLDRLHFGANGLTVSTISSSITVDTIKHWVIGLYTAQVRTLVQEIYYISEQYADDLEEYTGSTLATTLRSIGSNEVPVKDSSGLISNGKSKAWSSSFITYLMLRLFTGAAGRSAAQNFLKNYSGKTDKITKEQFAQLVLSHTSNSSNLDSTMWSSLTDRYVIVSNVLSSLSSFSRS